MLFDSTLQAFGDFVHHRISPAGPNALSAVSRVVPHFTSKHLKNIYAGGT